MLSEYQENDSRGSLTVPRTQLRVGSWRLLAKTSGCLTRKYIPLKGMLKSMCCYRLAQLGKTPSCQSTSVVDYGVNIHLGEKFLF